MVSVTGASDVGSGDYGSYITDPRVKDEDGFDIDDSDYDIFIEEVCLYSPELNCNPIFCWIITHFTFLSLIFSLFSPS